MNAFSLWPSKPPFSVRTRLRASLVHLAVSVVVAGLVAILVFGLWYPWPYRLISGGQELFLLIVSVDVVLGPMLTFVVFNVKKSYRHIAQDLAAIGLMQLVALGYGVHTLYIARPVALVFEVDRFRAISAADVHVPELSAARPEYRRLPLTGTWLLAARNARNADEKQQAMLMALQGVDVGQRPTFWEPYEHYRHAALARSREVGQLMKRYAHRSTELERVLNDLRLSHQQARFLPLMARQDCVVILDSAGTVVGFAPFDGFF